MENQWPPSMAHGTAFAGLCFQTLGAQPLSQGFTVFSLVHALFLYL